MAVNSWDPKTRILILEKNKKLYKIKILHEPTSDEPFYKIYLFNTKEIINIHLKTRKQKTCATIADRFEKELCSPLAGRIVAIHVAENETITKSQPLVTIESMKMENIIHAKYDAFVKTISISKGDLVQPKQVIMTFEKRGEVYAT